MPMKFTRVAVIAAAAMLFAGCAGEPGPEPVPAGPEPGAAPSLDGLQPVTDVEVQDPDPESVKESEPAESEPAESEPAEPEPECPEGEHRHEPGGVCHPVDPEPEAEPVAEPTPASEFVPEPVDEPIEDYDPAEHVLVEPSTDPDAHPCDQVVDADDGELGVCTVEGERYCFNVVWSPCPGGQSTDPCAPVNAGDASAFSGAGMLIGDEIPPSVALTEGLWRVDVCLWDNDLITGAPSQFTVSMAPPAVLAGEPGWWVVALDEAEVAGGAWSVDVTVPQLDEAAWLLVTPSGGGSWTVRFTPMPGTAGEAS